MNSVARCPGQCCYFTQNIRKNFPSASWHSSLRASKFLKTNQTPRGHLPGVDFGSSHPIETRLRVPLHQLHFRSQAQWDHVLTCDVKLSERFESVRRTIYALGFTCVVVMGINRESRDVCDRCRVYTFVSRKWQ